MLENKLWIKCELTKKAVDNFSFFVHLTVLI